MMEVLYVFILYFPYISFGGAVYNLNKPYKHEAFKKYIGSGVTFMLVLESKGC